MMGRKKKVSAASDEPKSRHFIAPTPVRLNHYYHSVLDYFSDRFEISTSDVIRMAIDQLLRSQPPHIIAEHRQYAETHYVSDLQDEPAMLQKLRFDLDSVQDDSDKSPMKIDSSEMRALSDGVQFDSEDLLGGPNPRSELPVTINSAKIFEDE